MTGMWARSAGRTSRPARAVALIAAAAALAAPAVATPAAKPRPKAKPKAAQAVQVQLVLTARDVHWRPSRRNGTHRLVLDRVAPRMAMMAVAPREEVAFVPASLLGANWGRLFRATGGRTNAVLSVPEAGRPVLHAVRLELVRRHGSGRRMEFLVSPLRATAHRPMGLGHRPRAWREATLLVDPTITDGIRAMWDALVRTFAGERFRVPPNPTIPTPEGRVFDNGDRSIGFDEAIYKGPLLPTSVEGEAAWRSVEQRNLDGALGGSWIADLSREAPSLSIVAGGSYEGMALFNHAFGTLDFNPSAGGRLELRNTALFEIDAEVALFGSKEVGGVDMGGANLRGFEAGRLVMHNSLLESVDLTGANLGTRTGGERGVVRNTAFIDVTASRVVRDADGAPDRGTQELERGFPLQLPNMDFISVTFQNADFEGAYVTGTTFSGCGLQDVNFSRADIRGLDPRLNGGRLQPTFEDAILESVRFEDARLENVSFARADIRGQSPAANGGRFEPTFSGDAVLENVSFDGARLENVSFAGLDVSRLSFEGATLRNVDFTGATGAQLVDWSSARIEGNVYGIADMAQQLDVVDRAYVRSLTFDGVVPAIDPETGFDVEPGTERLIDPSTGVRLERESGGGLEPVDPSTGERFREPETGRALSYEDGRLFDPLTDVEYRVDYASGELRGRL